MLIYIIFYLLNSFVPMQIFTIILGILAVSIFVFSIGHIKNSNRIFAVVLVSIGSYILIRAKTDFSGWMNAFTENSGLISLLMSLPMLSIILYYEDFEELVSDISQKYIKSHISFYVITTLIITFTSLMLNVASLYVVHKLIEKTASNYPEKLVHSALVRGYGTSMLWSPNFLTVAVSLQASGISWMNMAPAGLVLAVSGTLLGIVMTKIELGKGFSKNLTKKTSLNSASHDTFQHEEIHGQKTSKSPVRVILIILLIIGLIVGLGYIFDKSTLVIVPLISVILPVVLGLAFRKTDTLKIHFKAYLNQTLPGKQEEFILFSTFGFLGYALEASGSSRYITLFVGNLGLDNPYIMVPLLTIIIGLLGFIGVHPIISVSAIAIAMSGGILPLSPLQFALTMSFGYYCYTLLCPFSGAVLLLSSIFEKSPIAMGLKYSWKYVFLFIIINTFLINLFN